MYLLWTSIYANKSWNILGHRWEPITFFGRKQPQIHYKALCYWSDCLVLGTPIKRGGDQTLRLYNNLGYTIQHRQHYHDFTFPFRYKAHYLNNDLNSHQPPEYLPVLEWICDIFNNIPFFSRGIIFSMKWIYHAHSYHKSNFFKLGKEKKKFDNVSVNHFLILQDNLPVIAETEAIWPVISDNADKWQRSGNCFIKL